MTICPVFDNKFARMPTGTVKGVRQFINERAPDYGFTGAQIVAQDRRGSIVTARQTIMAEAYATGRWGIITIGKAFERDHSTVAHALKKFRALAKQEAA
jgi:chromosomal replication initiation ATPase DnaA